MAARTRQIVPTSAGREKATATEVTAKQKAIGAFMKDILTVVTFVMVAMCFAVFLIAVKPDLLSAIPPPGKPAHCKVAVSREPVCGSESETRES
jgi:hypothetical protein